MLVLVLAVKETECLGFPEQLLHMPGVKCSAVSWSERKVKRSSAELPNVLLLPRCNGSIS